MPDALTRERQERASHLLRNHAALTMYAVGNGIDIATARVKLIKMLATGWSEEAHQTPRFDYDDQSLSE